VREREIERGREGGREGGREEGRKGGRERERVYGSTFKRRCIQRLRSFETRNLKP
jgi:hypothetical protein